MREERGQALVAVILMLTIVLTLGVALVGLASSEKRMAVNQRQGTQALFLADGGVQYALARLRADHGWRTPGGPYDPGNGVTVDLGDGSFTVWVTDGAGAGEVSITTQATVGVVTRKVAATATIEQGAFSYALLAYGEDGSNELGNNVAIDGLVLSNQDLEVGNNPQVSGFIYVNGELSGPGAEELLNEGKAKEGAEMDLPDLPEPSYPTHAFPTWEENWYLDEGLGQPYVYNRSVTRLSDLQLPGVNYYVVQGDVDLGGVSLSGLTVVATGKIELGQNSTLQGVTLKAGEDLEIGQNSSITNSKLVADGDVDLGQDTSFSGTIYAGEDVDVDQRLTVTAPSTIFAARELKIGQNSVLQGEIYSQATGDHALVIGSSSQASGPLLVQTAGDLEVGQNAVTPGAQFYGGGDFEAKQNWEAGGVLVSAAGKAQAGKNARISGAVYSRGRMTVEQNLEGNGVLSLVAGGDVSLGQNADLDGIIYSAGGVVSAERGLNLTGSIVAAGFQIGQNADLTFDAGVVLATGMPGTAGVSLTAWDER